MTSVRRLPPEIRANSTGRDGPSRYHRVCSLSAAGEEMSEPHPITAICISLNLIIHARLSCNNAQLTQVVGWKNEIYSATFNGLRQFQDAIETVLCGL